MRTILLVAAEPREFRGILRRCGGAGRLSWPVWYAGQAEQNGDRLLLVANGPGQLAAVAVEVAMSRMKVDTLVSTGVCGALDPAYETGEIFVATSLLSVIPLADARGSEARRSEVPIPIRDREGAVVQPNDCAMAQPRTGRPYRSGALLSTEGVIGSAEEKRILWQAGAAAVDMEAALLARPACRYGLRFYCLRAVMDRADDNLRLDFNALRDAKGRFSRPGIVRATLAHPVRYIPELMRLAAQERKAVRALGDFIGDCQF